MRKSVFVLAVIGAACSSAAFAAEVKKDKAHAPAVKATTMSDSDMDKVTAGITSVECAVDATLGGAGLCTALFTGQGNPVAAVPHLSTTPSGVGPGFGKVTAASTPGH